jgi:hypothetical protein
VKSNLRERTAQINQDNVSKLYILITMVNELTTDIVEYPSVIILAQRLQGEQIFAKDAR